MTTLTLTEFAEALEQRNAAVEQWKRDLVTIASRYGRSAALAVAAFHSFATARWMVLADENFPPESTRAR